MSFKWKKVRVKRPAWPTYAVDAEKEELYGIVHGEKATDIEERMYRAFLNNGVKDEDIIFQPSYLAGKNMPGEIRPDFVLTGYGMLLIWYADEEYFHKSAADRARDKLNDARLMDFLEDHALPPIRIPGEHLEDQETADAAIGEHL